MPRDSSTSGETPKWFRKNIGIEAVSRVVGVKGVAIHYRMWGGEHAGKPCIVLVHGASAHSHWWDFIAPEFLEDYRIVAIDCAGAGESSHKDAYPVGDSAAEIMAVCQDAGVDDNAFLAAHSFGYFLALQATLHFSGHFRGLVGIDPPGKPEPSATDAIEERSKQIFATRSEAIGNFKLNQPGRTPSQPTHDYIVDYIAQKSVKQIENGWSWKADPNWAKHSTMEGSIVPDLARLKRDMGCPLAFVLGKDSAFYSVAMEQGLRNLVGSKNVITVNCAGHHVHLDQPLQFVYGLKQILSYWAEKDN